MIAGSVTNSREPTLPERISGSSISGFMNCLKKKSWLSWPTFSSIVIRDSNSSTLRSTDCEVTGGADKARSMARNTATFSLIEASLAVKRHKSTKEIRIERYSFVPFVANSVLELEPAGNLDDAVQSAATDRVRLSDLTESRTVDVEDRVAGSVQPETGRKNSG